MDQQIGAILVVDDEMGPRESLRLILKPHYRVFAAGDGKEALSILRKEKIDVVTLDLKMPGFSGLETLKEIRRFCADVEVVVITAYGTPQNAKEASHYGVKSFICKPFDPMELLNYIRQIFEKRNYQQKNKNQNKYNALLTRG